MLKLLHTYIYESYTPFKEQINDIELSIIHPKPIYIIAAKLNNK